MGDDAKSRSELLQEIEELRKGIARLKAQQSSRADTMSVSVTRGGELLRRDSFDELAEVPRPIRVDYESTESIELKSLFTRDVTVSGSFDIRGGIWATTFGKVIQALPIPAFLIDEFLNVAVANQACGRFTPEYEKIQGRPFASLLGGQGAAKKAESLLRGLFSDRKPRVGEGRLRIEDAMVWGRMTFRSIRVMDERFVLVLVEDLTREKIQLNENELLRRDLEKRVEKRTAELRKTNENLILEVGEREKAEQEREQVIVKLQQALAQVKRLSGFLPICASCKKIRDDKGYWQQVEAYIRDHSEAEFSHGLCPECAKKLYPELFP
jgi:PAS domain-containing protein